MTTRRRFLTILAGAVALPSLVGAAPVHWRGIALGAEAKIILDHPDAEALLGDAVAEIKRLESLFSLHQNSQLTRLNRDGFLNDPAPEMLEILSICTAINARTNGAFDPTIQPLWALYARAFAAGSQPAQPAIARALDLTGWQHVQFSTTKIHLSRMGVQLTLNGIAQGYIADKIAALFRARGVEHVLINTGEIMALGHAPDGQAWPITLAGTAGQKLPLSNAAIATSAPLGTTFDINGTVGHILDPRTGRPGGLWPQVSVVALTAAQADGLSTAFCLMQAPEIEAARSASVIDVII